jgi:exocyst complex component 3
MYTKSWYKSSTIIDGVLNIIDEEYLMPFIDFSYPELLVSLFDFITDDFLLNYINMLNYKRNFEKKVVAALERDGHKIMEVLGKHDEDGILENKMIIIDILIELISSEDESAFVEKWSVALSEVYDLPVDLMRIILECKKVEKSKITFIIGECEDMCKQSMTEHADKPASIFRKFHYSPMKK